MSEINRVRTTRAPWLKSCVTLCVVGVLGWGIALTALADPERAIEPVAALKVSSAIVVPEVALDLPSSSVVPASSPYASGGPLSNPANVAVPAGISGDSIVSTEAVAAAPALPGNAVQASSTPVSSNRMGIPIRALEGYRDAASLVNAADPGCNIDWSLLAAIGSVESNHARFGGNGLDSAGVARPGIIGIPLDGSNGTARITDSDGGLLDRDRVFDRAVGPMQFIPSTWRIAGADADGDGVKNPQDMADAATASAIYLCSGPGDLRRPGDLRAAILRYNHSDSYVRTVTGIASSYGQGVDALPASDRPAGDSADSTSVAAAGVNVISFKTPRATSSSVTPRPASTSTTTTSARKPATPAVPRPTTPAVPKSTPAAPIPATSTPATSTPATSTPATSTRTPVPSLPEADEDGRDNDCDRDDDCDRDGDGGSDDDDSSGSGGDSSGSGSGSGSDD